MKLFLYITAGLIGCFLLYKIWIQILNLFSRVRPLTVLFLTPFCFVLHYLSHGLILIFGKIHPHLYAVLDAVRIGSNWRHREISAFINEYRDIEKFKTVQEGMRALNMKSVLEWYWSRNYLINKDTTYLKKLQMPQIFIPGLEAAPFHTEEKYPWIDEGLALIPAMREELANVIQAKKGFQPYRNETGLVTHPFAKEGDTDVRKYSESDWNMLFFYKGGQEVPENHLLCPITSKFLKSIPRLEKTIVCFSSLKPGRWIPPHYGFCNAVIRIHIPIIIPGDCQIQVGEITKPWSQDKALVFDDSFRHQVWNKSNETRIVLFINVLHPDFRDEEIPQIEHFLYEGLEKVPLVRAWRSYQNQ